LDQALKKLFAFQKRRARALGVQQPLCGAVTFCQRFGSLLNLNCHFHSVLPEGVFYEGEDGVGYMPLPPPSADDIERLNRQIARATEKLLARSCDQLLSDETTALTSEHRRGIESVASSAAQPSNCKGKNRLASLFCGYSLHAGRYVEDTDDLEELCRYGARAPVANSRLSFLPNGKVQLSLKRPMYDGRKNIVLEPQELLRRLATLIPPPYKNLTRYHGVFAPNHRLRSDIVGADFFADADDNPGICDEQTEPVRASRRYRRSWAELLKRVFAIDIFVCDHCQGPMKILAVIPESEASELICDHLHLEMPNATGPPQVSV
jgi:hypothetical protein